jgi:hypothetical protein
MNICASWMRGTDVDGIQMAISAISASGPLSPRKATVRAPISLAARMASITFGERPLVRTETDDEIATPDDRLHLAAKGRSIAHIVADGREQGGILGQDERQQPLSGPFMRTDTLHFSSHMLGIAGTPSIPA